MTQVGQTGWQAQCPHPYTPSPATGTCLTSPCASGGFLGHEKMTANAVSVTLSVCLSMCVYECVEAEEDSGPSRGPIWPGWQKEGA